VPAAAAKQAPKAPAPPGAAGMKGSTQGSTQKNESSAKGVFAHLKKMKKAY